MCILFERVRSFIYRNARPLDLARWQYHFDKGSKEAVLTALACYQNTDGGFGHALEPDAWNPESSPVQTWAATEVLREISLTDRDHPIIQGILHYLASGQDYADGFWFNSVAGNNDHPHASWWHFDSSASSRQSYNPTACLAGFILRFATRNSELHQFGCRIAREACDTYLGQDLLDDMHTAACYIRLWQYCVESGLNDLIDLNTLEDRLRNQVRHSITKDTGAWGVFYSCRPSQFLNSRNSVFYLDNRELADFEYSFIRSSQLPDGSWSIPWSWKEYPEAWSISRNWWKADVAIRNLLYLRGSGDESVPARAQSG